MGSNSSRLDFPESSNTLDKKTDELKLNINPVKYNTLYDIPPTHYPPTSLELIEQSKKIASKCYALWDPTSLKSVTKFQKLKSDQSCTNLTIIKKKISEYDQKDDPYTEKTYEATPPTQNDSSVWISSTKNSDHTISYWIVYPVNDIHLKIALLYLMNVKINAYNLGDVSKKFPGLYIQSKNSLINETVECQQVDPLFMYAAIKSLCLRGYTFKKIDKKNTRCSFI